jgi:photosystem II stability/assembly factor-like uncharacterized protein
MFRATCTVLAVAVVLLTSASAQSPAPRGAATAARPAMAPMMPGANPALLQGLRYRLVGPPRGGRVTAVTGVPSQPRTFYMGAASGGLFRTTDGGVSWQPITDGKVPVGSIGAIAVADTDPSILYLGTGSDGVRSNVSTGRGMYKSTDAGATWQFVGLYNAGQIGAVRVHPTNPNIVWVSAVGDIFKANAERGIFKTTDGGRTWKKTLYLSDQLGAMDVEIQPGNPNVVYAWMSRLERKPWTIISGSRDGGFYKSTDGGETFARIATGLPNQLIGKGNLAVTAASPNRVYALVEALPGGGFYRSDDAGETWALVNAQASLVQRPFYYTTLGADPSQADVVYAGAEGFFKSTDAGRTFAAFRTPHGDNHDIWINPRDGNTMIQANDGGANVSFDGGRTWSTQMNQPTAEIYGVWVDQAFPYRLYGAQQDNSTIIISSQAAAESAADFRSGPGCETGPIMPHPSDKNIVYGSCKGQYEYLNLETGQSKSYWVGAQSLYGNPATDLVLRFQRVSPMATSPHDPAILYYGSQHLHRTRDKGVTWEKMSPDLTARPEGTQGISGEPITRDITGEEFYSTLYAITESPHERGVIWTGANDGPVHLTRDNGKTWTNVTPKDLPPGGRVMWIEASPHRRGSVYLATYRYLLGDYQPYFYRTDDYGRTWTKIVEGIPSDWPTRVLREDPDREGLLYGGTEFGMFVSFDNGAHWQPFQLNLPATPITDLRVHRKDLVVSTQGRAFWILDNLSVLHQLQPAQGTSAPILFKPRDGYRTRSGPQIVGPALDYYLPAEPTGAVTIDILDAAGVVVNSFNSNAPAAPAGGRGGRGGGAGAAPPVDPDDAMMEGRTGRGGAGVVSRVTRARGLNRFVWNGQHASGLPVPPGTYQARLTVGDATLTQPLTLLIDPRIAAEGITVADLKEQFDHNTRMRAMVAEVGALIARVRDAQNKLRASSPGSELLKRLDAAAGTLLTEPVRYGKPGLQAHISYLAGLTAGADMKIGRDAIERHDVLRKELDAVKAQVQAILGG